MKKLLPLFFLAAFAYAEESTTPSTTSATSAAPATEGAIVDATSAPAEAAPKTPCELMRQDVRKCMKDQMTPEQRKDWKEQKANKDENGEKGEQLREQHKQAWQACREKSSHAQACKESRKNERQERKAARQEQKAS